MQCNTDQAVFSIGSRVKIMDSGYYSNSFVGKYGVVKCISCVHQIGVLIDGFTNSRSRYGVYWFKDCYLSREGIDSDMVDEKKEKDEFMLDGYVNARVAFTGEECKPINYALYDADDYQVGDLVIVSTGHHGIRLAELMEIKDTKNKVHFGRQIVCKIDTTAFEKRCEKACRIKELKSKMDKKIEECQQNAIYEMFAEKDPELKQMYEEFKSLEAQKPDTIKHGKWIKVDDGAELSQTFRCSECGREVTTAVTLETIEDGFIEKCYPYCHCGAKMSEED